MSLTINDATTYLTGVVMAIAMYFGLSTATSNIIVQILVPIVATLIVSYLNEKYPSKPEVVAIPKPVSIYGI